MKKHKVISVNNLPSKVPVTGTLLWILILDRLDAPGWVWGVFATLMVFLWIVIVTVIFNSEYISLFTDNDS